MLEGLLDKFKKLNMPEESLLKKLKNIKKTPDTTSTAPIVPDISLQLKINQDEMVKKVEEMIKSKSEKIDSNVEAIKEFDVKLNRMESTISTSKQHMDDFRDRLDKIDESLLELLSLYEVVSSTVNPFVGEKDNHASEKIEQIEKKIEVLSQKTPEIPANLKEEYDIKFKALESSLEALTQMVGSNPVDQESLIGKVSERVLEHIKPAVEQKLHKTEITERCVENDGAKLSFLDNRAETSIIILNWIEFLLEKVGRNNLADILEYYIEIGWINEEVCSKMMAYANGIDYYVERPTWKLLPEDHTKSLMFIEQLTGKKMDKQMLSKLERNVEKVIRDNEIYTYSL